jgi:hypothetical protein
MPLQADTYLQIGGGKLVKVFKKGDLIKGKEVTDFLSSKKIAFLYIKKGDASLFMDRLNQEVERLLNDPAMTPDKATGLATDLHQAVSELNRRLGFTPEVQKVVHQGIRTALQSVGVNPELAKILKGMVQDRHRYIASHSVLVSQVSCGIAAMMKWPSDTTFQKLSYAAFFHDMTLENHSLAQVGSLKELEEREAEFTMDEIKSYRSHPADAAQLISTFHEIPSDVDTILIQHHERPEGDGFPRGLPPMQMASLSCVFVVAHDWVDQLFKNGNSGLEDYMQHYKTRCNRGPFKKIIEAIEASGGFKL